MAIQKIPNTLIADNAVTAAKIANGTLTADDIAANSITGAKISATTSLNLAGLNSTGNVIIGSSSLSANAALKFAADTGTFTLEHDRGSHSLTLSDSDGTGEILRIDTSGKVGMGVTPKTDWHTGYNAIQIGQSSAFFANGSADEVFMSQNARWTSGSWKYNSSGTAALFDMQSGNTRWRRAASGSEDGTISWSDSMFIDTSGHVGIGTTSPTVDLDVSGPSSSMVLPGTSGTTPKGFLRVGYNDRNWGGTELLMGVINDGNVGYAGYLQAKAPTDYSVNRTFIINPLGGNVLVGTTSTTVGAGGAGVSGFRVDSDNGIVQAAAVSNPSAIFNRTTSDGNIVSFRKNGSEVGSIGTEGAELTLGSNGAGLQFLGGENKIRPFNMDTNAASNGVVSLGRSNAKFADLYLSGAIKMDSDLDDYEEGTYTATISCASGSITLNTSFNALRYTKVGRHVHVQGTLAVSSVSSPSGATYLNLPFTSGSDTKRSGNADNVISGYFNGSAITNGIYTIYGNIPESSSTNRLFVMPGHQNSYATYNLGDNFSAGGTDYYVNFTYTT